MRRRGQSPSLLCVIHSGPDQRRFPPSSGKHQLSNAKLAVPALKGSVCFLGEDRIRWHVRPTISKRRECFQVQESAALCWHRRESGPFHQCKPALQGIRAGPTTCQDSGVRMRYQAIPPVSVETLLGVDVMSPARASAARVADPRESTWCTCQRAGSTHVDTRLLKKDRDPQDLDRDERADTAPV